jgi:hypothetical protein
MGNGGNRATPRGHVMGKLASAALALLLAAPGVVHARLADLEVYDRTDGAFLPIHEFRGQRYVAGTPGHEYELRLRSNAGERLLAVTSVDGVNVVTGETAAPEQGGYVLGPYQSLGIAGWRKSLDEVAAFYFTPHRNSYAARTGRPFDVGVLGVALFREKQPCCAWLERRDGGTLGDAAAAPESAPEELQSQSQSRRRAEDKLGTGHGRREHSAARHAEFERASSEPDEIIAIYYDSRANLVAQGVIPRGRQYAQRGPRPFPGRFVPDP